MLLGNNLINIFKDGNMNKKKLITLLLLVLSPISFALKKAPTYTIDLAKSYLTWEGKAITHAQTGKIKLKSGSVTFDSNLLSGGEVVIDMESITADLKDAGKNKKLVDHLKGADFFNVVAKDEKFKTAKIVLKDVTFGKGGIYNIFSMLTIKGNNNPLTFNAKLEQVKSGGKLITADFEFDRTKYGIEYNSSNFFKKIGDKAIHDSVKMSLKLYVN